MAELSYTVDLNPSNGRELVWSLLVLGGGAWALSLGALAVLRVATTFLRPALLGLAGIYLLIVWPEFWANDDRDLTVTVETDGDSATVSGGSGSFTHSHPDEHSHGPGGWSHGGIATHRHDYD